jgi:cell division initiation protein
MDLTPEMLRTVEFNDAKKGGYDHDEVDDFLDRAAADLAKQHAQLRDLESRISAAEQRAVDAEAASRDRSDSDETLRRTLILAQRTADAAIKEAQDEGARIVAEARQKADGMIASAEEQVRREVGATRDRLQAEIRDLEGRRGQLHDRITELSAHFDSERDRLRRQVDQIRSSLEDETLRVAPIPGVDPEPSRDTEPSAPEVDVTDEPGPAADATVDDDLSDLPPPPVDWTPSEPADTVDDDPEPEPTPPARTSLFETPAAESAPAPDLDLSDGGPPTQATPVVSGASSVGSSHLDELKRAVSDGPDDPAEDDDAAMAAFFDQDDDEERSRRFGRRR